MPHAASCLQEDQAERLGPKPAPPVRRKSLDCQDPESLKIIRRLSLDLTEQARMVAEAAQGSNAVGLERAARPIKLSEVTPSRSLYRP